jgi:hypothetical protein
MAGVAFQQTLSNGVTTTWATIINISWQPGLSASVLVGFFLNEGVYTSGGIPVCTEYVPLNVSIIDPTLPIPGQLFSQLTAVGAPLAGGTLTS